jgi:hypothetical protein
MTSPGAQSDFWVAADEVPPRLKESAKWFADLMPPDYWRRVHGSPGFSEIITLYGIPIRVDGPDGTTLQVSRVTSSVPAWVADVERSCNSSSSR